MKFAIFTNKLSGNPIYVKPEKIKAVTSDENGDTLIIFGNTHYIVIESLKEAVRQIEEAK